MGTDTKDMSILYHDIKSDTPGQRETAAAAAVVVVPVAIATRFSIP